MNVRDSTLSGAQSGAREHTPTPVKQRHVVILGPPGSGKSVVGLAVARQLERPFFDVDTAQFSTCSRHHWSQDSGEIARRRVDWLSKITSAHGRYVLAAPWASADDMLTELNRADGPKCWVVLLTASIDVLEHRLVGDEASPETIRVLRDGWPTHRRTMDELSRSVDLAIPTDHLTIPEVVERTVSEWRNVTERSDT